MATKGPFSPSSDGNFNNYVLVDAFKHYVFHHPPPRKGAIKALNVLYNHCIVKFGISDIVVTDNRNQYINGNFTHFRRI